LRYLALAAADLPVLAIQTGEVTAAEENIADSLLPANGRFFSFMNTNGTDVIPGIAPAFPGFTFQAVHPAVTRTNPAFRELTEVQGLQIPE